jgi:hypothetical protein
MRSMLAIVLLLLGAGLLSCQIEGRPLEKAVSTQHAAWVRTIDGWERMDRWSPAINKSPALHPLVVAAGQLLVSLFALAAAEPANLSRRNPRPWLALQQIPHFRRHNCTKRVSHRHY